MEPAAHRKHGKIVKPSLGNFGRNEFAILGAPCTLIKEMAAWIASELQAISRVAYVDADHKQSDPSPLSSGFNVFLTDKIGWGRYDNARQWNAFETKNHLKDCDLVLINGNHFEAKSQIALIHPDKKESLERKLDRLHNVRLVILSEGVDAPWPFMKEVLAGKQIPVLKLTDKDGILAWFSKETNDAIPALRGLVLAGGQSLRMGRDKGLIDYHGKPQREYLADLLKPFCAEVFLSTRHDQPLPEGSAYPALPDTFLDLGPFGALLSAFRAMPDSAWLVVACDLPLLDEKTLRQLVSQRSTQSLATAFNNPTKAFPEPLITIWEPKAYPTLLTHLSQGSSCPRKVLINNNIKLINLENPDVLTNVNTPEELEAVRSQ
jgi:molybdopterin-guanine dinucleotide biosynthesis protein A